MKSIRLFINRFDAFIQKRVDAAAFFLMRRGIGKPWVRYWTMSVYIITLLLYKLIRVGPIFLLNPFTILMVVICLVAQRNMLRSDLLAEKSVDTLSKSDKILQAASPLCKPWGMLWVGFGIFLIVLGERLSGTCSLLNFASFLFVVYLARTPYTPPPIKEKVPIRLQSAPAPA